MHETRDITPFAEFLKAIRRTPAIVLDRDYKMVTLPLYGRGARLRKVVKGADLGTARFEVRAGDLMISKIDARKGSNSLLPPELDGAVVTGDFLSYSVDTSVMSPAYMDIVARSTQFSDLCDSVSAGTTNRVRLDVSKFLSLGMAVPNLREQRRIVDLIGTLDEAIESAVQSGELTVRVRVALSESLFGVLCGGSTKPLLALASTRLGKMLSSTTAGSHRSWPYLRNANVQWGRIDLHDLKEMPLSDVDRIEFELRKGDLLICEGGIVGRSALVTEDLPGIYFQKAIHRVRCNDALDPAFLYFYMQYLADSGGLEDFTTGTTIRHLTGEKLRQIPVPDTSSETQSKIVGILQAFADTEAECQATADSLRSVRTNILATYLSGEHEIPSSYDEVMRS
ncbi:restriction endonuclease subunit S [Cryobacterium sp. SO2]|uniref:restriction endonuclease subunit S n=1 Tax=Cryobacterium sp. SO2 TaxID=1897060 RepID=UPI00223CF702|nr:restriction endonuclease subunit S [Cryobacterium sp. SO2]WEO76425.1 restriction endonuclease subunit S [Cryobacterium sp. SO2]